jgi:hypothetical protein
LHGKRALTSRAARGFMGASIYREQRMEARERRLVRTVILLFGALLAVGAWQGYGVLIHGIEGSYAW